MEQNKILVINPGSTSTKIAVFKGSDKVLEQTLRHKKEELEGFNKIVEQYEFRMNIIKDTLAAGNIDLKELKAIAARGGLLKALPCGGTYLVNEAMCEDLRTAKREHASNLAALIGYQMGKELGISCYVVDPVVVDELQPMARLSGLKGYDRGSVWHTLNQKAVARKVARMLGTEYKDMNCIVAHMGGGITVAAHEKGRAIDVNNGLRGDGPFSPERTGGLPCDAMMKLIFDDGKSRKEVEKLLAGQGGFISYLNTNDAREVEKMAETDEYAELVYKGMAYQVSKEIASLGAVLYGKIDAVILTGGIAHSKKLTSLIKERVSFMAPVYIIPGEEEMEALAAGVKRVLDKEEEAVIYK